MKKYIMKTLPAALALALAASAAQAGPAVDFGGYFRSGLGTSSKGGKEACFKLDGASSKYRLGNECETYGELALGGEAYKGANGFTMRFNTRLAYVLNQDRDFETSLNNGNGGQGPAFREANVIAENIGSGAFAKAKAWVGKRYYERNDVHITDYYYLDTSAPGAGLENIDVGVGNFAYAVLRNADTDKREVLAHDLRLSNIQTNTDGNLLLGVVANQRRVNSSAGAAEVAKGYLTTIQHFQGNFFGGFNKVAFQYGTGSQAGGGAGAPDFNANKDSTMTRVVEQFLFQTREFSGMGTFVYQDKKNGFNGKHIKWTSIGARPIYHFADNLSVAVELGHDRVKEDGIPSTRTLTKFTIAPQLSAGNQFFSRPALRAFYTYAKWNSAAQDAAMPGDPLSRTGTFGPDRNGSTLGFQVETWW